MLITFTPCYRRRAGLLHYVPEGGEGGPGTGSGEGGTNLPGGVNPPAGGNPGNQGVKTFSQDELDRIVSERLTREREKYKDHDALRDKAKKWDEYESQNQTAIERAEAAKATAEREAAERIAAADSRLIAAEIKSLVAGRVHNPDVIVSLLAGNEKIKVNGTTVEGAKEVVEQLLNDNPYLKKTATNRSGPEFGGSDSKTLDEQIAAAEQAGDWRAANRLKLQKLRTG